MLTALNFYQFNIVPNPNAYLRHVVASQITRIILRCLEAVIECMRFSSNKF